MADALLLSCLIIVDTFNRPIMFHEYADQLANVACTKCVWYAGSHIRREAAEYLPNTHGTQYLVEFHQWESFTRDYGQRFI